MNITPQAPTLSITTAVNPPTEGLRRENQQREVIIPVGPVNRSTAEKGVASDKDRAKTPNQSNEQIDFASLRRNAENTISSIGEQRGEQGSEQSSKEEPGHENEPQDSSKNHKQGQITDSDDKNNHDQASVLAEQKVIGQLQSRDKEVRQHELAHANTGGSTTGSPAYSFEVGPDGKKYAISGEVDVDLSSVPGDPQATITKMQKVHAAALAPATPSSQDIRVAASASRVILAAQSEILAQQTDDSSNKVSTRKSTSIEAKNTFNLTQTNKSDEFTAFINQTLSAQEKISPSASVKPQQAANSSNLTTGTNVQSNDVQLRSQRIESFYFTISQGYEKPDNFQFELTV